MSKAFQVIAGRAVKGSIASAYVYGERNSGTNYVQNLILRNCVHATSGARLHNPDNRATLGWKHGFPSLIGAPSDVLAIVVYRDPIAWLHSMMRNPWHGAQHLHGLPFSQFIREEWAAMVDDTRFGVTESSPIWHREMMSERDPATGLRFANVMRLRNAKNRGFATLDHRFSNILRVNYESVLANPEVFLNALCATYGLRRLDQFDPIIHDRGLPTRGNYTAAPLPFTNAADLDFIRSELDLDLEASLGYSVPASGLGRANIAAA
jgi:hypothetical protein